MRKINKILSGLTAATIALGSLSAYVAFASSPDAGTPEEAATPQDRYTLEITQDGTKTTATGTCDTANHIKEGGTVTVSITPTPGYKVAYIEGIYDDDENITVTLSGTTGNSQTFTFAEGCTYATITVTFQAIAEAHTITVAAAEHGTVTVDKDTANTGDKVKVTATPADGYELDKITVIDTDNADAAVEVAADGTFTMPNGNVTVSATFVEVEKPGNSDPNSGDTTDGDTTNSDDTIGNEPASPAPSTPGTTTTPGTSDTTSSDSTSTTTPAEVIEGKADVTPGTAAKVETDAGEITVTTDAEDEAIAGTTFVVETVKDASADLTTAVGASATEETKEMVTAAAKAVTDGNAVVLDFSFEKDGADVQPGKAVTLEIPVPAALKGASKVYIYHVGDDGVTLVDSPEVKDGKITFTAEKFSPYIFSKVEIKAAAAADGGTTTNPGTGIALAVAPIVLAAGFVSVVALKKKH